METAHDVVVRGTRSLLADLSIGAPSRTRRRRRDALLGLDRLVAEHVRHGSMGDTQAVSAIAAYRDRYDVTAPTPLGHVPETNLQLADHATAEAALRVVRAVAQRAQRRAQVLVAHRGLGV